MGANRLSQPPTRPQSTIWTSTHSSTVLAAARAIGVVDFYSTQTGQRSLLKPLRLPSSVGKPTTISLRPSSAPQTCPLVVIGTASGHVLLDQDIILQIAPFPVLTSQYHESSIVVVGGPGNSVIIIDPANRTVKHRFSLASQHLSPIKRVVIQDDSHALFCSQALTYVDLTTGEVKRRFIGHKTAVSAAVSAFPFAFTACEDSFLSVWCTNPVKDPTNDMRTKRRRTSSVANAEATLVAPYPGIRDLYVDTEYNFCYNVAALMSTGDIAVWRSCDMSKASNNESTQSAPRPATFCIQTNSVNVHTALFSRKGQLTIFRGSPLKPTATAVPLEEGRDGVNIVLSEVQDALVTSNVDNADRKLDLVRATARLEIANCTPAEALDKSLRKTKRGMNSKDDDHEDDDFEKANSPSAQEGERADDEVSSDEENGEPTLEEKLKALGVDNNEPTSRPAKRPSGKGSVLEVTRLDSRASVLLQAVRVKDSKMMESCLYNMTEMAVVRNTIRRIPSAVASGDLLDMLVQRLRDRHDQVEILTLWIKVILLEHAGTIISQRRQDAISTLACVIEERIRSLDLLSRLQGRLELIVGQSNRIKPMGVLHLEPAAEYEEDEEDDNDDDDDEEDDEEGQGEGGENNDSSDDDGEASDDNIEKNESMDEDDGGEDKDDGHTDQVGNGGLSPNSGHENGLASEADTESDEEDAESGAIKSNRQVKIPTKEVGTDERIEPEKEANGKMEDSNSESADDSDSVASEDDDEGEA